MIVAWRREYNEERTHSTIGDVTRWSSSKTIKTGPRQHRSQLRWPGDNKGRKVNVGQTLGGRLSLPLPLGHDCETCAGTDPIRTGLQHG